MRVFRGLKALPAHPRTIVIGNLDGVHRGHQALLAKARAMAEDSTVTVLTFEPHPKDFFKRNAPNRLMRLNEKLRHLCADQVDEVIVAHFNAAFASQSGERFARDVLKGQLHAQRVIVGEGFRFGYRQSGEIQTLMEAGIEVTEVAAQVHGVTRISSTKIREALTLGDLGLARQMLGHGWVVRGRVFKGQQLGRTLGFPTANLFWHAARLPVRGIYAVRVGFGDERPTRAAVASIGDRPTVNGSGIWLEVHLFDFDGDLYGRTLSVELWSKLRDEVKFDSIDDLCRQMDDDARRARQVLLAV